MSKELSVKGRQEKVSKSRKWSLVTSSLTGEADRMSRYQPEQTVPRMKQPGSDV